MRPSPVSLLLLVMDLSIDFHSSTPAYLQLADKLRAAIDAGELKPQQPIPSLKTLVAETGLATNTVIRAIDLLEKESRVYSVRGRGNFVTPRNRTREDRA